MQAQIHKQNADIAARLEEVADARMAARRKRSGEALCSVPGIGKRLAERLHPKLGINSLEELEAVAHDERLIRLERLGSKRIAGAVFIP